jgi:hypothetical protein
VDSLYAVSENHGPSFFLFFFSFLLVILNLAMSSQNMTLEFFRVAIPQLCGLTVQGARAVTLTVRKKKHPPKRYSAG